MLLKSESDILINRFLANFQKSIAKWSIHRHVADNGLKGQCHEIFELYFFSLIKPIWAPDKQAKMVFLKNSFSRRYSNLKFEKFDSAQANTARSRNFLTS